jgi:ADP-ribosylglycohydrolase
MLVEAAIGDSYGAPFEYAPADWVAAHNDGETYWDHPKHPSRGRGRYTDDTQMAIAVAVMMINDVQWTKLNIANHFVTAFKRDERTGYARGFYSLLKGVNNGAELLETIVPDSDKSGGAMRAFPIGLYPSIDRVKAIADIQASVTHDTPDGRNAAVASALTLHFFAYRRGLPTELPAFIREHVEPVDGQHWDDPWEGPVGEKGWMSVRAAITALAANDNLQDVLRASVAFTGDVDTVATIALGAGYFAMNITRNLPQSLYAGLENLMYGHDYLKWLDRQLFRKFSPFFP